MKNINVYIPDTDISLQKKWKTFQLSTKHAIVSLVGLSRQKAGSSSIIGFPDLEAVPSLPNDISLANRIAG